MTSKIRGRTATTDVAAFKGECRHAPHNFNFDSHHRCPLSTGQLLHLSSALSYTLDHSSIAHAVAQVASETERTICVICHHPANIGFHPWLFFFHGSLAPIPGCFSFMGPWVPSLAVFLLWVPSLAVFPLSTHSARVSANLPLAFWLTASLVVLSSVSRHTSRDSAFPRGPLAASSVAGS